MYQLLKSGWVKTLAAVIAMVCVQTGKAVMLSYTAQLSASYTQDTDGPPTSGPTCYFFGSMYANTNGDLVSGNVNRPDAGSVVLYSSDPLTQTFLYGYSSAYTSTAALVADYPAGDYTFEITGGNLAPATELLSVFGDDFSNETPYFNGGTYSGMQMAPAGSDGLLTWDTFTHPGSGQDQDINLFVSDYTAVLGLTHFGGGPASTYLSETIPGATLRSGHTYVATLYYYSSTSQSGQGFGGATSFVSYARATNAQFHIAANPGTVSGQIVLEDYYYPAGQTVTAEVVDSSGVIEDSQTVVVGHYGWYAFDTTSTGAKTVTFKGSRFLKRAVFNVDLDVGQDAINVSLKNGDVDDDNEVTIGDFAVLSQAFNSLPGDPNWDTQADLNGDAAVDIGDYAILSQNFGLAGD